MLNGSLGLPSLIISGKCSWSLPDSGKALEREQ